MKKSLIIAALLFVHSAIYAQSKPNRCDVRFGVGTSFLGTGDMRTLIYETELNYKLNPYFTASVSAASGRSAVGVFDQSAFMQGNLNVFVSPFKNTKTNDFRIGGGLSFYAASDAYRVSSMFENGQVVSSDYRLDSRRSAGANIIVENTVTFGKKYLLGVKAFTQPYFNGDINSGIVLKVGVKI